MRHGMTVRGSATPCSRPVSSRVTRRTCNPPHLGWRMETLQQARRERVRAERLRPSVDPRPVVEIAMVAVDRSRWRFPSVEDIGRFALSTPGGTHHRAGASREMDDLDSGLDRDVLNIVESPVGILLQDLQLGTGERPPCQEKA